MHSNLRSWQIKKASLIGISRHEIRTLEPPKKKKKVEVRSMIDNYEKYRQNTDTPCEFKI